MAKATYSSQCLSTPFRSVNEYLPSFKDGLLIFDRKASDSFLTRDFDPNRQVAGEGMGAAEPNRWYNNREVKEYCDKAFFQIYVIWLCCLLSRCYLEWIDATFKYTCTPSFCLFLLLLRSLSFTSLLLFSWITVTIIVFWWFPTFMFMFLFLLFMRLRFSVPFSLFFMTGVLMAFIWITFTCCGLIK